MPKIVPKDVEMTKPGSKMKYKLTYPDGNQKWVREKPGHKSEKWKEREKERMLKVHPEINDFFAKLKVVVDNWVAGKADNAAIEQCVREFETTAGWNKARMVMRRLKRSERVKYNKAEKGEQKDYYGKVLEALQVGVDFVARRSRDDRKKAGLSDRMVMIASNLVNGMIESDLEHINRAKENIHLLKGYTGKQVKSVLEKGGLVSGRINTYRGPKWDLVNSWWVRAVDGQNLGPYYPKRDAERIQFLLKMGFDVANMSAGEISEARHTLRHGMTQEQLNKLQI